MYTTIAVRATQPIGEFFVTTIPACKLREWASVDVRRIVDIENEEKDGIQRQRNEKRIKEIKKYISMGDSSFPNSIILAASSEQVAVRPIKDVEQKENSSGDLIILEIEESEDTFKIIDGQHRLFGFDDDNCKEYELVVTIFIDLPVEDQAYIFSTINLKQSPVDRSLVYDLYDEANIYSPYKAAHNVAKLLNGEEESPFYRRIKLLGVAPRFEGEILYRAPLSQNAIVREILKLISKDPDADREQVRLGRDIEYSEEDRVKGLIFREFYARKEDWAIYAIMRNYFNAFAKFFGNEWNGEIDSLMPKTVGYGALMRVLVLLYQKAAEEGDVSESAFDKWFEIARKNYEASDTRLSFDYFDRAGSVEPKVAKYLLSLCEIET